MATDHAGRRGAICEDNGEAALELLTAFNSDVQRDVALSGHAFDAAFVLFAHVLSGLADGDHPMFGGAYAVRVRHYTREELDTMPEFSGY